ncbi:MAG: GNAT family N-acetyltransferase [Clostridia bacterium]|nr:GNAT family N-acetyltransferase [Clostridia bacterium]
MTCVVREAPAEERPLILAMSADFAAEGCCNGVVPFTPEQLEGQDLFIAWAGAEAIGYAVGHVSEDARFIGRKTRGRCYEAEEIYVKPAWRGRSAGADLMAALRRRAEAARCEQLQLTAVGKDWPRLLRFYTDRAGLRFWCATMYQEIAEAPERGETEHEGVS